MTAQIIFAGLQWSGKIGPGTILTAVAIIGGLIWGARRISQGDPSEWRENYIGQLERTTDLERQVGALEEKVKHQAAVIEHLEATRSLEPVLVALERIANRLDHLVPS